MKYRRYINSFLATVSKQAGFAKAWGYPSSLMIEPTNTCNLSCILCPTGAGWLKHRRGRMDVADFQHLIDEAGPYLYRISFWNWGEPFLHPDILDMVNYARQWPAWIQVSTNGHFFSDPIFAKNVVRSGLDQLIISVDGVTSESIQQYRGNRANLDMILNGIRNLVSARQTLGRTRPLIEIQFLVMKHNQNEIEAAQELAIELGADRFYFKTLNMRKQDIDHFKHLLPDDPQYRRFEIGTDGDWSVKGRPTGICPFVYETAVVLWDGSLVPCCYDGEEAIVLGNAFENGLWHAWNSDAYRQFRYRVRHDRASIPMCAWCPESRVSSSGSKLGRFWTDITRSES